jgi:hypothetical protein
MTLASDIFKFLESKETAILLLSAPDPILKALEELSANIDYESMETNGWEWDWWIEGKYKKQKLMISGSGYYGNAKIEKRQ